MKTLCLMPVYNQVDELPELLSKCRNSLETDLLIIDDGSTDGSEKVIRDSGFGSIRIENRKGVGHALITGTQYAIDRGYEVVAHIAGNGKMNPAQLSRLLRPLSEGLADYVWGSRYLKGGQLTNTPAFRRYGIKYVFNLLPLIFTGRKVSDATCGFRAYRISLLERFAPQWDHRWLFGYEFEYYVLAKALLSPMRCREVPISMIYPTNKKRYSKIIPVISWWSMLKPWVVVGMGWDKSNDLKEKTLITHHT